MRRSIARRIYDRIILDGLPGLDPPKVLAERLRRTSPSLDRAAARAVAIHTGLGSSQGFAFGLPGLLLLPVTLPANLLAAAAVQLHLAATMAALAGEDPASPAVRERCVACLLRGGPASSPDEESEVAARTGVKLMERGVRWGLGRVVRRLGRSALRRIGVRSVPIVGGIMGAAADGWATRSVGACAREEFGIEGIPEAPAHPLRARDGGR